VLADRVGSKAHLKYCNFPPYLVEIVGDRRRRARKA
jgi:hypothetical protein